MKAPCPSGGVYVCVGGILTLKTLAHILETHMRRMSLATNDLRRRRWKIWRICLGWRSKKVEKICHQKVTELFTKKFHMSPQCFGSLQSSEKIALVLGGGGAVYCIIFVTLWKLYSKCAKKQSDKNGQFLGFFFEISISLPEGGWSSKNCMSNAQNIYQKKDWWYLNKNWPKNPKFEPLTC